MSQMYEYLKSTFKKNIVERFDPSNGYNFISSTAINLRKFGFTHFEPIINLPISRKQNIRDQVGDTLVAYASALYNKGDLEAAFDFAKRCYDLSNGNEDKVPCINALHLMGRIHHENGNFNEADKIYDEVLHLSVLYDHPPAFVAIVHEKSRLAVGDYKLLEAEAGFRFALDYYATCKDIPNMNAAIKGLRNIADQWMLFSQGPVQSVELIRSFESDRLSAKDYSGFDFFEIRSLATYCIAAMPEHREYLSNLVRKAFQLKTSLSGLSDLALNEAEYISLFLEDDTHITSLKTHLHNSKTTTLKEEPFKVKMGPTEHQIFNPFNTSENAAENIEILYNFLQLRDKCGSYIYRGQTREYETPLLPSAFRDILNPKFDIEYKSIANPEHKTSTMRACGSVFVGEYYKCFHCFANPIKDLEIAGKPEAELKEAYDIFLNLLNNYDLSAAQQYSRSYVPWISAMEHKLSREKFDIFLKNEKKWMPIINDYHKRVFRSNSFFQLFGYALSTTFAQQYGLSSEGLDATKSLDVAVFFATHHSQDFQQVPTNGTGIIYRFPYNPSDIVSNHLNKYNYSNLPSIVDLQDIMYRFEKPGFKIEDSLKCFDYYFGTVFKNGVQDLDLLFLPERFWEKTRLAKQEAVIIFPDEIRNNRPEGTPGIDNIGFSEIRYIEDIAKREGVEKFYFRHNGHLPAELRRLTREELWPRDDDLLQFIVDIMMAQYPSRYVIPQRLDLIDGAYDQAQFTDHCVSLFKKRRISLFDGYAKLATRSGVIVI